jgi:hypothetical protein
VARSTSVVMSVACAVAYMMSNADVVDFS